MAAINFSTLPGAGVEQLITNRNAASDGDFMSGIKEMLGLNNASA